MVDAQTIKLKEKLSEQRAERESARDTGGSSKKKSMSEEYGVLARFVKKK